ncbi:MAG: hypothetical protein A2Y10_20260 [Planctomycetes bacterium GWF2_41_51]|nr:MAG: hypothetical protein A2Y10_20260 [Planctomycetes bacterium GWF2_41_51]HBG25751.1 hypothetical protein [Phycisphaerales bacterium]
MIILDYDKVAHCLKTSAYVTTPFYSLDNGDVYSMIIAGSAGVPFLQGALAFCDDIQKYECHKMPMADERIHIIFNHDVIESDKNNFETISDLCRGWVLKNGKWILDDVKCISVQRQLLSRFGGIIETDIIAGKKVLIMGVGSFGSDIALGLVKSGVTYFILIDDDRFDIPNIMRHICGLSQVGRYKTKAIADIILDKNSSATVTTFEKRVNRQNSELLRDLIRSADIVVCAIDDRDGKVLTNRLCVEENKTCIFTGAFRRAYGGQILRVHPHQSLCYQCFLKSLPEQAANQEISNDRQAKAISYSDRPVPVEPGLANDITPITQMVCKLVIQELLKDKNTTLRSLDEDLAAPLYLWFNRRETGSDQENWEPLEFNCDGMHILRWYGVAIDADPACPVCGDFLKELARQQGHKTSNKE